MFYSRVWFAWTPPFFWLPIRSHHLHPPLSSDSARVWARLKASYVMLITSLLLSGMKIRIWGQFSWRTFLCSRMQGRAFMRRSSRNRRSCKFQLVFPETARSTGISHFAVTYTFVAFAHCPLYQKRQSQAVRKDQVPSKLSWQPYISQPKRWHNRQVRKVELFVFFNLLTRGLNSWRGWYSITRAINVPPAAVAFVASSLYIHRCRLISCSLLFMFTKVFEWIRGAHQSIQRLQHTRTTSQIFGSQPGWETHTHSRTWEEWDESVLLFVYFWQNRALNAGCFARYSSSFAHVRSEAPSMLIDAHLALFSLQGRLVMSNKRARLLFFIYMLVIHLLVFLVSTRNVSSAWW